MSRSARMTGMAGMAAVLAVASLAVGASEAQASIARADDAPSGPTATMASIRPGLLFSLLAPAATVTASARSRSLTVPVGSPVAWFTDRPARMAGTTTAGALARSWKGLGFATLPPNAVIVSDRGTDRVQEVVTVSRPRLEGPVVTFTIRTVPDGRMLGMRASGRVPVGDLGPVEVFIDPAWSGSLPPDIPPLPVDPPEFPIPPGSPDPGGNLPDLPIWPQPPKLPVPPPPR